MGQEARLSEATKRIYINSASLYTRPVDTLACGKRAVFRFKFSKFQVVFSGIGNESVPKIILNDTMNTIRYDTRCYFNVLSKAGISQLNLPHGNDN